MRSIKLRRDLRFSTVDSRFASPATQIMIVLLSVRKDVRKLLVLSLYITIILLCSSLTIGVGNAVLLSSPSVDPTSEVLRQLKRYREAAQNPVYSNDWAVQVYGGEEAANEVATLHGFINMGRVCHFIV